MHHEFARNSQVRHLQSLHGDEGGILNKASADELLCSSIFRFFPVSFLVCSFSVSLVFWSAAAADEGMPHFSSLPWKNGVRQNPHTDGYVSTPATRSCMRSHVAERSLVACDPIDDLLLAIR